MSQPWYKNAVFYQIYTRAFADSSGNGYGDLRGVIQHLDHLQTLGVDCVWLMPIYPSPRKDDGYDISDFYSIDPQYGTLDDLQELVAQVHARGMHIIMDLVLNHTSDQHAWFQSARSDPASPYREYYVWSDTDQKYSDARIIFLDTEKSNWSWDEQAGQYFWHRFYSSQPDLNFDSPRVQEEMLNVVRFWLELGIDGFRADAVPYLFEREGSNCENLPETHQYLKRLRGFIDEHFPQAILLCEANQWPEDVRPYFGDGDEFHMGFHFPVMPRIFMSLRQGRRDSLEWILDRTPPIPDNCQWCTFLRNHDELTLEMVTEEERQWMWQEYAPDPRMRLNLGIRRRLAPLLGNDRRKIELAYSLLFTLPGSPIVYYGDEIGMGDNIWLFDRNGVRTPMQWTSGPNAGFSSAAADTLYAPIIAEPPFAPAQVNLADQRDDPGSLYHLVRRLIQVRKRTPSLSCTHFEWLRTLPPAVAAYRRCAQGEEMVLILNNLSDQPVQFSLAADLPAGALCTDLITGAAFPAPSEWILSPYQYRWLRLH